MHESMSPVCILGSSNVHRANRYSPSPWTYRAADYTVPSQFPHKCRCMGEARGEEIQAVLSSSSDSCARPHCFHCWFPLIFLRQGFPVQLCYPGTHSTVDHHCHSPHYFLEQEARAKFSVAALTTEGAHSSLPWGCSFSVLSVSGILT